MRRLFSAYSVLAALVLVFAATSGAQVRDVAPQRECGVCHIAWLEEFRRAEVTPLVEIPKVPVMIEGRQGVVSTERMCFTCHDGYVNDSRFAFNPEKHRHPVYVTPDKVKIPKTKGGKTIFPLNQNGEVYCGTCHSAHGRSWEQMQDPTKVIFLRETTENSAICVACHLDKSTGPKGGNHPFYKRPEIIDIRTKTIRELGGRFGAEAADQVICQSCHKVKGAPEEKILIRTNRNSELCGTCHYDRWVHSLDEARKYNTHPVNITSERIDISERVEELGSRTGEGGTIICQTCHSPHYAQKGRKIFVKDNSESGLCLTCHDEKKPVTLSKHNMAKTKPESENYKGIPAKESGPCSACHVAHRGKGPRMWGRPLGPGVDPFERVCLSCHSEGRVAEDKAIATGPYSHPVGRDISLLGVETDLPLYVEGGARSDRRDKGRVLCITCHDVHQWDPTDPEKGSGPEVEGDGSNSFLRRTAKVQSSLCAECHKDKLNIRKTKHDLNVMDKEAKNVWGATVEESGVCSACHVPHNGTGPKMWARDQGPGEDTVEKLCLSCHNDQGLARDKTIGRYSHPVGRSIENLGIETELPLYNDDGAPTRKSDQGNVVCATCHNVHQWNPGDEDDRGGKKAEGNGMTSFLRAAAFQDSSLCGKCHSEKLFVRETKHDLRVTAEDAKNVWGSTAGESGVCSACHVPHNGNGPRMWAREEFWTGSEDQVSSMCLSCHNETGLAKKKTIGEAERSHPLGVSPEDLGLEITEEGWASPAIDEYTGDLADGVSALPLYGVDDRRDTYGRVTCATCHNPHKWDPDTESAPEEKVKESLFGLVKKSVVDKSAAEEEGDGNNSFLRVKNKDTGLCRNCHVEKRPVVYSKHNLAVSAPDEKNSMGTTAGESGACSSCHVPHRAKADKLWARDPGPGGKVESLCTSCHSKGSIAREKVVGNPSHPLDMELKDYMTDVPLPLYDKEGKVTEEGGTVVCLTCHNPHQWVPGDVNSTAGADAEVEGDVKTSFLRYPAGPEPKLCGKCHSDKLFVLQTDHDLRVTAPEAENAKGQNVYESGVCGQCHAVHNAPGNPVIFARTKGPGQDAMEMVCRGCHEQGKVAEDKQPFKKHHPKDVTVISSDKLKKLQGKGDPNFPVFTKAGERDRIGYITCPTCHNPHKWSAWKDAKGPGEKVEGNALNSFLRNKSQYALCTDCHGFDGLFRYKYFHGTASRKNAP